MAKNKYEFTGGDNLKGLEAIYHDVMMFNELSSGKGSYKLSDAGGKSSPSFGGNQMDLAANKHGREVLLDIVTKNR